MPYLFLEPLLILVVPLQVFECVHIPRHHLEVLFLLTHLLILHINFFNLVL